ncbi:MAG TPA: hypothetical protein VM597_23880 [Gemmataceae bacterium]|jgi:hypothetical protein|nr:hypothetical protein [Gemmataceae bacterium]
MTPASPVWAGPVRVWRVEAPAGIPPQHQTRIDTWVARAAALGLADALSPRPARRTSAYLDLPGGPYPAALAGPLPAWPDVTAADVPGAFHGPAGGFRDVPIVRAERVDVVVMAAGNEVDVFEASRPGVVIARVPRSAFEAGGAA